MTVDLDARPTLKVNVLSCSKGWFLLVAHPRLSGGYVRLIETDKPGPYEFNIPKLTGLSGPQNFEVQIGVSDPGGVSIKGQNLVFETVRFKK